MRTNLLSMEPLLPGTCEWCGKPCELKDVACSLSCEAQLVRLEAAQGKAILRTLKKWRKYRGRKGSPGEGSLTEATNLVDSFLRNDRLRREEAAGNRRRAAAKEKEKEKEND